MKSRSTQSSRKSAQRAPRVETRAPTYEDVARIVELLRNTNRFSEFRLRSGDIEVEVRRANGAAGPAPAQAPERDPLGGEVTIAPPAPAAPHPRTEAANLPPGLVLVRAPMIGTLYRAPEPGAAPFVEVGSRVAPDTTVCIIEVMKLMNSISAECAGVVTHVLVENAEPVEQGQALIAIDPNR